MTQERIKEVIQESLRDWFKKENWVRINTQGNITGPCGTMKKHYVKKVAVDIIEVWKVKN